MVDLGDATHSSLGGATGNIVPSSGTAAKRRLMEGISAALICQQDDEDSFVQLCRTWHAGLVARVKAELQGLVEEHQRAHEGELQGAAAEASKRRHEDLESLRVSLEAAAKQREEALRAEAEGRLAEERRRSQRELEGAAAEASKRRHEELELLRVSMEAVAAQREEPLRAEAALLLKKLTEAERTGDEAAALEKRLRAALKKEKHRAKELSVDISRFKQYCSLMHPDALVMPSAQSARKAAPGVSQGGPAPPEQQLCSRCLGSPIASSSITRDDPTQPQRSGQARQKTRLAAAEGGLEAMMEDGEEEAEAGRRRKEKEAEDNLTVLEGEGRGPADRAPTRATSPPHAAAASNPRPRGPRAPPPRFSETRITAAAAAAGSSPLRSNDGPRGLRGGGSTKYDAPIEDSEDEIDCVPETDFEGFPWTASWTAAGAHDGVLAGAAAAADEGALREEDPAEEGVLRGSGGGEGADGGWEPLFSCTQRPCRGDEKRSLQSGMPMKGGEEEGGGCVAGPASVSTEGVRSRSRSGEEAEPEAHDRVLRRMERDDRSNEDQEGEQKREEEEAGMDEAEGGAEEEEKEDKKGALGGEAPSRDLRRTDPLASRSGKQRRRESRRQLGSSNHPRGRSVESRAAGGDRGLLSQTAHRAGDCIAPPEDLDDGATMQTSRGATAAAAGSIRRGEGRAEPQGGCSGDVEFSGIEKARDAEDLQVLRKGAEEAAEEETKEDVEEEEEESKEESKEEERKAAEVTMEEEHGRKEAEEACGGDAGGGSSCGSPARARSSTPVWSPTRLQRPEASSQPNPLAFGAVSPHATQPPCSEATRLPHQTVFRGASGAEDRAEGAAVAAAARGLSRRQVRDPELSQEISSRPPPGMSKQSPNKGISGSGDEVNSPEPVNHDSTMSDDHETGQGRRALNHRRHPPATAAAEDTGESFHLPVRSLPEPSAPMPRSPLITPSPPQLHKAIGGNGGSEGIRKRGRDHYQQVGGGGGGGGGPGWKQPKAKAGSSPKWRTKARSRAPRAAAAGASGAAARDPFDLSNLSQASLGVVHVHRLPSSSAAAAPAATGTIQEYFSRHREAAANRGGVSVSGGGSRDRQSQGNAALRGADSTGAATSGISSGREHAINGGGSSGGGRDHQQGAVPCEAAVAAGPAMAAEQDREGGGAAAAAADGERPDQPASSRSASHPLAGSRWGKAALTRPPGHQAPPSHKDRNSLGMAAEGGGSRAGEPSYKFREVVRKRAEREALPAHDCPGCTRFYAALESWRVDGGSGGPPLPRPACGHVNQRHVQRSVIADGHPEGATGERPDRGRGLASVKELRQEASRHRHRHKPPETPPGFWDMGFMDSLDSRVVGGED